MATPVPIHHDTPRVRQIMHAQGITPDQISAVLGALRTNGFVIVAENDVVDEGAENERYRSMIGRVYQSRDRRESHRRVKIVRRAVERERDEGLRIWAVEGVGGSGRTTFLSDATLKAKWREVSPR